MGGKMTKYVNYKKPTRSLKERMEPHPVWRGIGLILAILIPVMAYYLVSFALENPSKYSWISIPRELVINRLWDPLVLIKLLYTVIMVLAVFIVIALFTFLINSMFGTRQ